MPSPTGRAFNEWLRAQLKAKKMSQRQLAQQSGVDHSTISRLVRGDRMPSLGTATKLARGLRELADEDEGPQYLGLMSGGTQNPTARVEYALRADEALSEAHVRQVMEYYLAVRMRQLGRSMNGYGSSLNPGATSAGSANTPQSPVAGSHSEPPTPMVRSTAYGRPSVAVGNVRVAVSGRQSAPPLRRANGRGPY
jgi:transcriptional regulator with XRE-family HTH domain